MPEAYTYSIDPPTSVPRINQRQGYRTPRSVLLPPYLMMGGNYFIDWLDTVDDVYGPNVDQKIDVLQVLRNMWVTNPTQEQSIEAGEVQDFEAWSRPEREILIKQVNMLGMNLSSAGVVPLRGYHAISRFLGSYWYEKGTHGFIEFLNFCLGSQLTITLLWTENYVDFLPEGDPGIGTPLWEGGTWYRTTHVTLTAKGELETLDSQTLVAFFYEIANYNLVLYSVDTVYDMPIVDDPTNPEQAAHIVAVALIADNQIVMSNYARYGS